MEATDPAAAAYPGPPEPPSTVPDYFLYKPEQVAAATFLGTPLAGGILIASNYRKLGNGPAAVFMFLFGVAVSAGGFWLAFALPERTPAPLVYGPLVLVMWLAAKSLQGQACEGHVAQGGRVATTWEALRIALVCLLAVGAGIAYYVFGPPGSIGKKVIVGQGKEVYYDEGATEEEAERLGRFLIGEGHFSGSRGQTARLTRDGETYVVGFVVSESAGESPGTFLAFHKLCLDLSKGVFGGRPVAIQLCDEYMDPWKTLRPMAEPSSSE